MSNLADIILYSFLSGVTVFFGEDGGDVSLCYKSLEVKRL